MLSICIMSCYPPNGNSPTVKSISEGHWKPSEWHPYLSLPPCPSFCPHVTLHPTHTGRLCLSGACWDPSALLRRSSLTLTFTWTHLPIPPFQLVTLHNSLNMYHYLSLWQRQFIHWFYLLTFGGYLCQHNTKLQEGRALYILFTSSLGTKCISVGPHECSPMVHWERREKRREGWGGGRRKGKGRREEKE